MDARRAESRSSSGTKSILLLSALLSVAIGTPVTGRAQTETVLYSFGGWSGDGTQPYGELIADSSGNLYGTTFYGGVVGNCSGNTGEGCGTVFELINSSGTYTEKVLYTFMGGSDGGWPYAGLIMDKSGNLYGTAVRGGAGGNGIVFEMVNSSGAYTEKVLYSFTGGNDGGYPQAGLIADRSGNLYGTTACCGAHSNGTVYELVNSSGTYTEKVLYSFSGEGADGTPYAGLIADGSGNLYGTTDLRSGTVYELVNSSGTYTEKVLHSFSGAPDGELPYGGLTIDRSGNIYGVTNGGGSVYGFGTVFELLNSSGSYTERVLYSFSGGSDGAFPLGRLIVDSSGNLYGTTFGGSFTPGTVFELVNSSGTYTEKTLYDFTAGSDGGWPFAGLIADSSGNLYGTTNGGGYTHCGGGGDVTGCGTVFKVAPAPDFTVDVASGASSSATVSPGGTASYSLSVSPEGGFNQTVTVACTGAPPEATCAVSPSSVAPDGTNPAAVTVSVTTMAPSETPPVSLSNDGPGGRIVWPLVVVLFVLLFALAVTRARPRARLALKLVLLSTLAWASCGGGGNNSTPPNFGTPPGNYTLTITGTSGSLSHSTNLTLTVN